MDIKGNWSNGKSKKKIRLMEFYGNENRGNSIMNHDKKDIKNRKSNLRIHKKRLKEFVLYNKAYCLCVCKFVCRYIYIFIC